MNKHPAQPDDWNPEWLAAYVDGELSADQIKQVECWLERHPDQKDQLEIQRSLTPKSPDVRNTFQPPKPTSGQWQQVYQQIEQQTNRPCRSGTVPMLPPTKAVSSRWFFPGILGVLASSIAVCFLLLFNGESQPPPPVGPVIGEEIPESEEVFQVAKDQDVEYIDLPESASENIVVGKHPLVISPVILATIQDVSIYRMEPSLDGDVPELPNIANTNDAPMLWAPAPREP